MKNKPSSRLFVGPAAFIALQAGQEPLQEEPLILEADLLSDPVSEAQKSESNRSRKQ
jgi:hypothetical protein